MRVFCQWLTVLSPLIMLGLTACEGSKTPAPVVDGLAASRPNARSGGGVAAHSAAPAPTNRQAAPVVGKAAVVETSTLPPPPGAKTASLSGKTAKPTNLAKPQSLTPEPVPAMALDGVVMPADKAAPPPSPTESPPSLSAAETQAEAQAETPSEPNAPPSAINSRLPALANSAGVGTAPTMIWPVQGRLLSTYGRQNGGEFNDGINLAANAGSVVKAAADGTVTYAGRDDSYGNLLLLEHANGWTTAYAHLEALYAKGGDVLKQGSMVGRVGATGKVKQPQLHFELRQGKQPVDPMLLMPKLPTP
ncbi:MAG: hypothetical protein FJX22_01110 [Alphaproteobacteria bacterium]|nr:hypothetical protein [Alphaproteobacteria bacterium]